MTAAVEGRQAAIFDYVRKHYSDTGVPPTAREVEKALGLSGPSIVHYHLGQLVKSGSLRKVGRKYIPLTMVGVDDLVSDRSRAACPWEGLAHDFSTIGVSLLYCRKCGVTRVVDIPA